MAAQVTNYKCPACTGPLQFDAESGNLICEYCGSTHAIADIEALYAQEDEQAAQAQQQAEAKREEEEKEKAESVPEGWEASGLSDDWGADAGTAATADAGTADGRSDDTENGTGVTGSDCSKLEVCMRCNFYSKILSGMRSEKAGTGSRLEVCMWRNLYGEVLS